MPPSTSTTLNLTRGYAIALVSAIILSTTAIFIRYLTLTYHLPPLTLAFWRDVFVTLTLLPVLGLARPMLLQVRRQNLGYLLIYGFVLATFNALWTLSIYLNGAAISTVLVYCSAGFTAVLGWWLLKEHLDLPKILAIIICLGGCALVAGVLDPAASQTNLMGILVGILSGLGYAIYSLMGRAAFQRGLNPWTTLLYTFGFAAIFLLFFALGLGELVSGTATRPADLFWLGDALAGWGILFLLAAGPTIGGYGLYNVSLSYLPSSVANLIVTLEPAFTAVIAYFLLGERFNEIQLVGSLMILAGVAFLRIYDGWLERRAQTTPQREGGAVQVD